MEKRKPVFIMGHPANEYQQVEKVQYLSAANSACVAFGVSLALKGLCPFRAGKSRP